MICRRCLRAAARSRPQRLLAEANATSNPRFLSTTPHLAATTSAPSTAPTTAPRQGDPNSSHNPPAATSTSAAQPFSTPLAPSPAAAGVQPGKPATPPVTVLSSVPAGTPLKGLNFLKNGQDPVAMEDAEYPSWLWEILKTQEGKAETAKEGDLFSKSKKQRRLAAKRLRKEQMANPELLVPKVPIYEQSIDLPAGDGSVEGAVMAGLAREELRKAMRGKRRASIKEANFLKAMN